MGLLLLAGGGWCFASGASRVVRRCGANPFIVGLIACGFGTTAAALAFDLTALARGRFLLALGNVAGVNIANVGLVLGLAAAVRSLKGKSRVVSASIPALIGATLLFWFLCRANEVTPLSGGILLVAFVGVAAYLGTLAKHEPNAVREQFRYLEAGSLWLARERPSLNPNPVRQFRYLEAGSLWLGLLLVVVGIAALVGGANLAVLAAEDIRREFKVTTLRLGTVAAAFGTVLPGLVVAVCAAWRGQSDVALGAVIGACLANVLLVAGILGLTAPLLAPNGPFRVTSALGDQAVMNEIPLMAVFAFLLLAVYFNDLEVPWWQGAILLAAYAGFVTWQVMRLRG